MLYFKVLPIPKHHYVKRHHRQPLYRHDVEETVWYYASLPYVSLVRAVITQALADEDYAWLRSEGCKDYCALINLDYNRLFQFALGKRTACTITTAGVLVPIPDPDATAAELCKVEYKSRHANAFA